MKKYKIISGCLLISFLLTGIKIYSNPVDTVLAKIVAKNYFEFLNPAKTGISIQNTITKYYNGYPSYYIINFANGGYITISANDAAIPILTYSYNNTFNENDFHNPAYLDWMEDFSIEIDSIRIENLDNSETIIEWNNIFNKNFNQNKSAKSIQPLLTTLWGQTWNNNGGYPGYNYSCPSSSGCDDDKCDAGCGPVAMGQIMKKWHPENTPYDWCNMPDMLTNNSTTAEVNAVAGLLRACGDAANVNYCVAEWAGGCATSLWPPDNARDAFVNNFSYSTDANLDRRFYYSKKKWIEKLETDLDNGRPVMYFAWPCPGVFWNGHEFVIDGYNEDDKFHINWGWHGSDNGYYEIGGLNPQGMGSYNCKQRAIFKLHPDEQNTVICIDCNEIISVSNIVTSNNPYNPNFPMITWSGISPFYNYIPFINPTRPFLSNIITENGETRLEYFDITAGTIQADNVTIPDKVNVHFKAYDEIVLTNFETEEGAEFTAEIIPCPNDNNAKIGQIQNDVTNISEPIIKNVQIRNSFQLSPNPCTYIANIIYDIDENESFEISLFDIFGKKVHTLIKGKQPKGKYDLTLDASKLDGGLYLCVFKTEKETKTIKFIKFTD
ncbi:MAG: thiol protease/hemagglutinin PrtT [Bacteroidales bacterium]